MSVLKKVLTIDGKEVEVISISNGLAEVKIVDTGKIVHNYNVKNLRATDLNLLVKG